MPAITQIMNPVTHSVVKLVPPVEIINEDELHVVLDQCTALCEAAWSETPRRDLAEIRDLRGWLKPDAS